ncbi:MAG TPA: hypothetical protein VGG39_30910 [Polyangiaceae bacterium]|jgi:hypothetical protein
MVTARMRAGSMLVLAAFAVGPACSSASSNGGGSNGDGGGADASSSGASSSGGSSSGSSSGGSSGGSAKDGAIDAPAAACPDDVPFAPATYPAVVPHQGVCTAGDIAGFLVACGDSAVPSDCKAWQLANVGAGDAGGGTACGNCILAAGNAGAAFVDQAGASGEQYFGPNYGACIQILDKTNGAACAPAYDAVTDCNGEQCDDCSGATTFDACASGVDALAGICTTYAQSATSACAPDFADGGIAYECSPGAATDTLDPDWQLIIGLVCGSGDGG